MQKSGEGKGNSANPTKLLILQQENDLLRNQLMRGEQERVRLVHQVDTLTKALGKQKQGGSTTELRQRCEQLAERLVASLRDRQVSQSSEIFFLLRTQQEERRFLAENLETLLEDVGLEDATARAERRKQMFTGGTPSSGALHAGTITQLMMQLSNSLHQRTAEIQFEKTGVLLLIERADKLITELQTAIREATRSIYNCSSHLAELEDQPVRPRLNLPQSNAAPMDLLDSLLARTDLKEPKEAEVLLEELDWSSDVLKATYRGLGEVHQILKSATTQLASPTVLVQPSLQERDSIGLTSFGMSAEMERLMKGFVDTLQELKVRAQRQQDQLVRRLSHELQSHYESAKQYEQRVRLLEEENTRLLTSTRLALKTNPQTGEALETYPTSSPVVPADEPLEFVDGTPEKHYLCPTSRGNSSVMNGSKGNVEATRQPDIRSTNDSAFSDSNTFTASDRTRRRRPSPHQGRGLQDGSLPADHRAGRPPPPHRPTLPQRKPVQEESDDVTFPYKEPHRSSIWRTPERQRVTTSALDSPSPRGPIPGRSPIRQLRSPRKSSPKEVEIPSSWRRPQSPSTSTRSIRPLLSPAK